MCNKLKQLLSLLATLLALGLAGLATTGCAPKNWNHEEEGAFDPLEPINRRVFTFNQSVDTMFIKPPAKFYGKFPPILVSGIDNFLNHLEEPFNAVNHIAQRNGEGMVVSVSRFAFNTVLGVGGLFDIADHMGVAEQDTDLGQTVRAYCRADLYIPEQIKIFEGSCQNGTAYLMLPLLGPTTTADLPQTALRTVASPIGTIEDTGAKNAAQIVTGIHKRHSLLTQGELAEGALDQYSFIRDAYEDYRQNATPHHAPLWLQR